MKQIQRFWNWFQHNEQAVLNAYLLAVNTEEVFTNLGRHLSYVSKRIGFVIKQQEGNEKCIIIFSGEGYRKLFPKLKALEQQAPRLELFIPQAFIRPTQNLQKIKERGDSPLTFANYELKISDLQVALLSFNIPLKQLKIQIAMSNYNELKDFEELRNDIAYLIMVVIGEINYRKHIRNFEIIPLIPQQSGLLHISQLQEYIDYMYIRKPRNKV